MFKTNKKLKTEIVFLKNGNEILAIELKRLQKAYDSSLNMLKLGNSQNESYKSEICNLRLQIKKLEELKRDNDSKSESSSQRNNSYNRFDVVINNLNNEAKNKELFYNTIKPYIVSSKPEPKDSAIILDDAYGCVVGTSTTVKSWINDEEVLCEINGTLKSINYKDLLVLDKKENTKSKTTKKGENNL